MVNQIRILMDGEFFTFIETPSDFPALVEKSELDPGQLALHPADAKAWAKEQVALFAEVYRNKITHATAGKLAEYRIKEEIARDPASASEAELELLSREAKARDTNRTGLIGQINAQATAYRQIALLIGALEAEAGAAITAIPDDAADIEEQIGAVLTAAKAEAESEYQNALALIAGA